LLIAIGAFLKHEMGARRPGDDGEPSADISVNDQIPDAGNRAAASPDAATSNDPPAETGHAGCQPRQ
jgi:hypothetical protein